MRLSDFSKERHSAFTNGFFKGLGAPAMLGQSLEFPESKPVPLLELDKIIPRRTIIDDFAKVGKDIKHVIERS